ERRGRRPAAGCRHRGGAAGERPGARAPHAREVAGRPPRHEEAQDGLRTDRRRARAARGGVRLPAARREPRAALDLPAPAQRPHVRRQLLHRRRRRHLPHRAAAARRGHAGGDRPDPRRGAQLLRRPLQLDARDRLRHLDPPRMGLAGQARGVAEEPRGLRRLRRSGETPRSRVV
ncbi:MAG: Uncharacterized protein Rv0487/MT0505 clustered with mycothiol biosynthesis gene, partial [uncultured Blastococcus sp.]